MSGPQYAFNRMPQTDDELWYFVYAIFGYKFPRHSVCPDHVAPFQAFADAYFARSPIAIWVGSRGLGGKSRMLSVLSLTEAVTLGCEVRLLGGSMAQSKNILDSMRDAWDSDHAPRHMIESYQKTQTLLTNGADLVTLPASETQVRGPHPARLRMDEIDAMHPGILTSARGMTMSKVNKATGEVLIRQQTVMSSTHQNPDGPMTAMKKEAREKGYPVYEWCYKESSAPVELCIAAGHGDTPCGWLTEQMIEDTKNSVSAAMWETEYNLQEPSIEGRAMDSKLVQAAFSMSDHDGRLIEYDDKATRIRVMNPMEGRKYLTSVDWAKEVDKTIVLTYDITDEQWILVAFQSYNKMNWDQIIHHAVDQWRHYGGQFVHDRLGVGGVVDDVIRKEMSPREFAAAKGDSLGQSKVRWDHLNEYIKAIEDGLITHPMIPAMYDQHRYATWDMLFGNKHLPDTIAAGALAWKQRKKRTYVGGWNLGHGYTGRSGWELPSGSSDD